MSESVTMFNLGNHCEDTMTQKSVSGIIIKTFICMRPKGHPGPHRAAEGLIWTNPRKVHNEQAT